MKKIFFPALTLTVGALIASAAAKDPVLMTVNGKKVPLSEFMYLYEKNNQQQQQPQSVDEYVEMFINYKLKVADAEAAGIDTTAAFINELNSNITDLATPYMRDKEVEQEIMNTISSNAARNVDISHIMLPGGGNKQETEANVAILDSLRTVILNGGSFEEIADKYSIDPSVKINHGHMGYITANAWPYPFEKAAFETPVGQISEPVIDLPYGVHIIKVNAERPDRGEVRVAHILKLANPNPRVPLSDPQLRDSLDRVAKTSIDSIYKIAKLGGDFGKLARENSDDPGSASRGGDVGFFGSGRMVPEFEEVAFSLSDGELSEPFKTNYGYHIIKRIEGRPSASGEALDSIVRHRMQNDHGLSSLMRLRTNEKNRVRFNARLNNDGLEQVKEIITKAGSLDSATLATLKGLNTVVATVGNTDITAADAAAMMPGQTFETEPGFNLFAAQAESLMDKEVYEQARKALYDENVEYHNLVNEYRDGNLLFEISSRKVWNVASKDSEGMEQYFRDNKDKYTWDKPHYKGYVVLAATDSVADAVRAFLDSNNIENDSLQAAIRDKFGRNARIDKVVGGKGDNAIVDYIAFDGPKPEPNNFWKAWFGYRGRVIDAPEEALDIRGVVSTDYQQYLEKQWVDQLRNKYKVKLNKKVLKSIENKH